MAIITINQPGAQGTSYSDFELCWGASAWGNSTSARYLYTWNFGTAANATELFGQHIIPSNTADIYVKKLLVKATAISGISITCTVRLDGVDTALIAVVPAAASGQVEDSNFIDSFKIPAGELHRLSIKTVMSGASANVVNPFASVVLGFTP
jgi:hypothetical protein